MVAGTTTIRVVLAAASAYRACVALVDMNASQRKQRLDAIAREAARLLETGRAASMKDALHTAADTLGYTRAPLPGAGRVRKHAQAMAMQAMGEAEYREAKRNVYRIAEELMTAIEQAFDDVQPLLVGRAAEGHTDAGVTLHLRLCTGRSMAEIAAALVELGYDEPGFDTVQTKYGAVNRILLTESGVNVVLSRCLPRFRMARNADMFTGGRIAYATVEDLRARIT